MASGVRLGGNTGHSSKCKTSPQQEASTSCCWMNPINHLDIPSRTLFEQALTQFEGSILAVVHDRYFIERFASEVWLVEGDGLRKTLLK